MQQTRGCTQTERERAHSERAVQTRASPSRPHQTIKTAYATPPSLSHELEANREVSLPLMLWLLLWLRVVQSCGLQKHLLSASLQSCAPAK